MPDSLAAIRADAGDDPPRVVTTDHRRRVFLNAYHRAEGWHDLAPYDPARNAFDPCYNVLFDVEALHFHYPIYPRWMGDVVIRYYAPADETEGFELVAGAERVTELYGARYTIAPRGGPFEEDAPLGSLEDDREPTEEMAGLGFEPDDA